jgi:preprotein translocase subunit SecB
MASDIPGNIDDNPVPEKRCILRQLFLKDLSFESPHVPSILFGHEQPELKFHVETTHRLRERDVYEVVLNVHAHAVAGDKTMFLIELKQGGLFEVPGCSTDEIMSVLKTKAPEALYPFARELISSLINRGGFPRAQLRPINFEAIYAEILRERRAAASAATR